MRTKHLIVTVAISTFVTSAALGATLRCSGDSIKVGTVCVDKYEGSVWQIDPTNKGLINKAQKGKATLNDLIAGGAVQVGDTNAPYNHAPFPSNFPSNGQWTPVPGSNPPSPGVY